MSPTSSLSIKTPEYTICRFFLISQVELLDTSYQCFTCPQLACVPRFDLQSVCDVTKAFQIWFPTSTERTEAQTFSWKEGKHTFDWRETSSPEWKDFWTFHSEQTPEYRQTINVGLEVGSFLNVFHWIVGLLSVFVVEGYKHSLIKVPKNNCLRRLSNLSTLSNHV